MNPRPILITLCGAVVFVALCYSTTTSNHQSADSPIRFSDGDKRLELLKSIRLLGEEFESR